MIDFYKKWAKLFNYLWIFSNNIILLDLKNIIHFYMKYYHFPFLSNKILISVVRDVVKSTSLISWHCHICSGDIKWN